MVQRFRNGLVIAVAATVAWGLAAAGAASADPAHDGPFGLYIGEPMSAVGPTKVVRPNFYVVEDPPKTNATFPLLAVTMFADTGVCAIFAQTAGFDGDVDASRARSLEDQLADAFRVKYGPVTKKNDSCAGKDDECYTAFAIGIEHGESDYSYLWKLDQPAPGGVVGIMLILQAHQGNTTLGLTYIGANNEACSVEINAAKASGL